MNNSMDLNHFYSDDVNTWKIILGEKMHYHYAISSDINDPFDQSIINLFPYINPYSSVLDCGCGWGGPANLIKQQLNCKVTGITISESQFNYIKNFEVICADLETFTPNKKYDTAIFIESYTHIINSIEMLKRFYNNVDSIIIKDFVSNSYIKQPDWGMIIRSKETFFMEIHQAGYKIIDYYEISNFFEPAISFWSNNFLKLDSKKLTGQIKFLYNFCKWYNNLKKDIEIPLNQCVIYATK